MNSVDSAVAQMVAANRASRGMPVSDTMDGTTKIT